MAANNFQLGCCLFHSDPIKLVALKFTENWQNVPYFNEGMSAMVLFLNHLEQSANLTCLRELTFGIMRVRK